MHPQCRIAKTSNAPGGKIKALCCTRLTTGGEEHRKSCS